MIRRLWSAIARRREDPRPAPALTVVMTVECRDHLEEQLSEGTRQGHEGVIYFLGLTTGTTTVALWGMLPKTVSTPGSFDVSASEMRKVVQAASASGLQVVGQLHTHPGQAYHSDGDLEGMKNRYPGYFSIVVPQYGAYLPSFQEAHTLMWTNDGFREVNLPVRIFSGLEP